MRHGFPQRRFNIYTASIACRYLKLLSLNCCTFMRKLAWPYRKSSYVSTAWTAKYWIGSGRSKVNNKSKDIQTAPCNSIDANVNGNNLLQQYWLNPQPSANKETIGSSPASDVEMNVATYKRFLDVQLKTILILVPAQSVFAQ
jgi:hypothetical protein